MIEAEWWDYETADEMGAAVSSDIQFIIERAVAARGHALIVVPGGNTPVPVFAAMAKVKRDWSKVTLLPTDERLVPADSSLSNASMIAKAFAGTQARVIHLAQGVDLADYKQAGRTADAAVADLPWPPDLVVLGMGADGHTASIFPGPDLKIALDAPVARRVVGTMPDPLPSEAPVARLTLTAPTILSAGALMMVISGDQKREVLEAAIEQGQGSRYPIGRVLANSEIPIDIHWHP